MILIRAYLVEPLMINYRIWLLVIFMKRCCWI